ncbi:MAG: methyltransferase regulatory domain-containing protein, partial [Gammaproteobacteria bacterium]|nr:methyltransferase regulatory domain-containing protein [Gammaproteobacteria bacterium]
PANLAVQGALFGLTPADPERCRVLELGCASGGNLIPMAFHLPGSEFLGVELSGSQVTGGRALIDTLGLANVRIEQADVLALDPHALGQFDYILAHGFYSWVPAAVRERLFAICQHALAPHGIAYVSYNTLPGWRGRAILRDMLLYFTRTAAAPRARLALAAEALEKLERVFAAQTGTTAGMLRAEIARLRTRHPSYLYHEYLAEVNEPVLFSAFMDAAGRHGLQYLCETELRSMFSDALGETGAALVDGFDDLLEQEQCIDFLSQRTFRQTLLCRAGLVVNRELDLERFAALAYFACLSANQPPDLMTDRPQPFTSPDGAIAVVSHPLAKAAVLALADAYPDAVDYATLRIEARSRVQAAGGPHGADDPDALLTELVRLYLRQFAGASAAPRKLFHAVGERPHATALARTQAAMGLGHAASARHLPMGLDAFAMRLLAQLDGTHSRDELAAILVNDIVQGRLQLDPAPADRTALAAIVAENCQRLLATFARHGLLLQA